MVHIWLFTFSVVLNYIFLLVTCSSLLEPVKNYAEDSEGEVFWSQNVYVTNKCDFKQKEEKKEYRPGGTK